MRNPHPEERITSIEGGPLAMELAPNAIAWTTPDPARGELSVPGCWRCHHPVIPGVPVCSRGKCDKWRCREHKSWEDKRAEERSAKRRGEWPTERTGE